LPKVSVIIPTYNTAKYINFAINSILNQTYNDYEIIVVDDGSTDNTKEVLKRYWGKIRYFYQQNQGVSYARNLAIKHAKGRYIALLDSDDEWLPDRLSEGVTILDNRKEVGLVHSDYTVITEDGNIFQKYDINKKIILKYASGDISKYILFGKIHINCLTVIFRKSCIEMVGNFDKNLSKLGAEDRDLWYRISRAYKIYYINKPLALCRARRNSLSSNTKNMMKARCYMINKYYPLKGGLNMMRRKLFSALYLSEGDGISWRSKDYIAAIKQYKKAINFFPLNFMAFYNLFKVVIKKILKL